MRSRCTSRGFSLVELMVATAVGVLLLAGLVSTVINTSNSYSELTKASSQIENGRYAISLLREDIQLAGFMGEYDGYESHAGLLPNLCVVDQTNLEAGLRLPLHGYRGTSVAPFSCLDNFRPNTGVLVVYRTSTSAADRAALAASTWYFQGLTDATLALGTDPFDMQFNGTTTAFASVRPVILHVYYIANCNVCGTDNIPTLRRLELTESTLTNVPLVEGIENMQFEWGIDDDDNGAPDRYISDTTTLALDDWRNVVSVQAHVLARNKEMSAGHEDDKNYVLGTLTVAAPGDSYKRHVFSAVVRAVNLSSRRED